MKSQGNLVFKEEFLQVPRNFMEKVVGKNNVNIQEIVVKSKVVNYFVIFKISNLYCTIFVGFKMFLLI